MFLGEIIKKYRTEFQLSQRDFSQRTGLSYTYISALEKNKDYRTGKPISPTLETVKDVAKGMNMSVDDLLKILDDEQELTLNADNVQKDILDNIFAIPIVGRIPAGTPLLAMENIEGYLPVDPMIYHLNSPEGLFYLKVVGNSMNNIIKDGGFALIKQQDYAETGDIIVALVNGDNEATLKRFKDLNNGFVMLEPDSSYNEYQPLIINLRDTEFKILGKLVGIHQVWA